MSQQTILNGFNAASLDAGGNYLPLLKIEEKKSVLVSFLKTVPGMPEPPFVYCRVHWNSEMGDNGRMFQCFGGACCEQVTWQKGWGGEPGKFDVNKARTRYYVPVVHYEQDPANPTVTKATIKYFDMTYTAYTALCTSIQNTTEGLDFFERDIVVTANKVNGATNYVFDKRESRAAWLEQPIFKQQVEEQLPDVAQRLLNSMPKVITESEFAAMKPELDAKVKAAMNSHQAQQQQMTQGQAQPTTGFNQLPTGVPGQPMPQAQPIQGVPNVSMDVQNTMVPGQPMVSSFTQPQVNIPLAQVAQPQAQPVAQAVQLQVQPEATAPAAEEPKKFEIPTASLEFNLQDLLK